LQVSCNLGGLHSSKEGANGPPVSARGASVRHRHSLRVGPCGPILGGGAPGRPRGLCSSKHRALNSPPLHAPLRLAHRRLSFPFGRSSQQGRIRYRTKPTHASRPVVYTRRPPAHILRAAAPPAALRGKGKRRAKEVAHATLNLTLSHRAAAAVRQQGDCWGNRNRRRSEGALPWLPRREDGGRRPLIVARFRPRTGALLSAPRSTPVPLVRACCVLPPQS
jgi:hypothetical protein